MRRRRLGALLLSITLVALMSLTLQTPRPSMAQTPGVYFALGDSIAAGIGSSLPRERGNAAIVTSWLTQLNGGTVPFENLAVPGETAATFIDAGQLQRFRESLARSNTAGIPIVAVSLSLGGNEMLALEATGLSDRQAGLDEFSIRYAEAVAVVRGEIGLDTALIVSTYYDLTEGESSIQFSDAWWIEQFNDVIRRVAEEHDALVAEVADRFAGSIGDLTHYPFDVHPTNAGHLEIARTIWSVLALDNAPPTIDVASTIQATRTTPTIRFRSRDEVGIAWVNAIGDDVEVIGPYDIADGEFAVLLDLSTTDLDAVALTIEIGDDAGNLAREVITIRTAVVAGGESQ